MIKLTDKNRTKIKQTLDEVQELQDNGCDAISMIPFDIGETQYDPKNYKEGIDYINKVH